MVSAKNKIYISVSAFLLILALAYFFALSPIMHKLTDSAEKINLQKKSLSSVQSKIESLTQFKRNQAKYMPIIEKMESCFIKKDAPVNFIEFLETEASSSNLLIDISPAANYFQKDKKTSWEESNFDLKVGGDFTSCLKFIHKLETAPYLIDIQKISIDSVNSKNPPSQTFSKEADNEEAVALISIKAFSKP